MNPSDEVSNLDLKFKLKKIFLASTVHGIPNVLEEKHYLFKIIWPLTTDCKPTNSSSIVFNIPSCKNACLLSLSLIIMLPTAQKT